MQIVPEAQKLLDRSFPPSLSSGQSSHLFKLLRETQLKVILCCWSVLHKKRLRSKRLSDKQTTTTEFSRLELNWHDFLKIGPCQSNKQQKTTFFPHCSYQRNENKRKNKAKLQWHRTSNFKRDTLQIQTYKHFVLTNNKYALNMNATKQN